MISEREKLLSFLKHRSKLIDDLDRGILNKEDFTYLNDLFMKDLSLKPFSNVKKYEEALFNYQFFNLKAKEALEMAESSKKKGQIKKEKFYLNQKDNYYKLKDEAILSLIMICSNEKIKAYPILMKSNSLRGEIFEIVFLDREKCILHTKNKRIKSILDKKKIFDNRLRKSLINSYVNSK